MTVNFPSGRSTSTPLRLFWRAPRISTQPRSAGAVTHFFSATFEPTGDYPRCEPKSQILRVNSLSVGEAARFPWDANSVPNSLFGKTRSDFFALLHQLLGHDAAE